MKLPKELRYTSSHEWVRREPDGTVSVGITDHAQEQLGDVVFVDVPQAGRKVAKGEACAVVESVKAASDIYAPVSGTVVAVNDALSDAPQLVNEDPYGEGWICEIEVSDESQFGGLLDAAGYVELVEG